MGPRWIDKPGAYRPAGRVSGSPLRRWFVSSPRRASAVVAILLTACLAIAACSEAGQQRVLNFFFDGVPKPGADSPRAEVQEAPPPESSLAAERLAAVRKVYHNHPPYWENRCGVCHNPDGGGLFRTAEEGLCQSCHPEIPGDAKYVHGPVVVNACLSCHHYHRSLHPKLLLNDVNAVCLDCHDVDDVAVGEHHTGVEEGACTDCHDPHIGDDRFFMKRGKR